MAASILSRSSGLHGTDGGLSAVSGSHGRGFNASRAAHAFKMGVYGALVVTAKKVSAKGTGSGLPPHSYPAAAPRRRNCRCTNLYPPPNELPSMT
jgi:hypothetical protein